MQIALAHDWLNQLGGAEDVALGLALLAAFASVAFMKGLARPSSDGPEPRDP